MVNRQCKFCFKNFETKYSRKLYCSKECFKYSQRILNNNWTKNKYKNNEIFRGKMKVKSLNYYKKNKDDIRTKQKQYYEDNKTIFYNNHVKRYNKNPDYFKAYQLIYKLSNPDKKKEIDKKYYENNKTKIKEYYKQWRNKNKNIISIQNKYYYETKCIIPLEILRKNGNKM